MMWITGGEGLAIPDNEMLFCGVAIGYEDESHPLQASAASACPLTKSSPSMVFRAR